MLVLNRNNAPGLVCHIRHLVDSWLPMQPVLQWTTILAQILVPLCMARCVLSLALCAVCTAPQLTILPCSGLRSLTMFCAIFLTDIAPGAQEQHVVGG